MAPIIEEIKSEKDDEYLRCSICRIGVFYCCIRDLSQTVSSPSKSFLESAGGADKMVFLDTEYLKFDVDCEEEAVIYFVRFTNGELERQLKADKEKADSAFYDMHNNQILMACRPDAFIRKFGLKQEVRTLLDRSGEVWHRWVTSSYDCL